jgi:hypothetical protein
MWAPSFAHKDYTHTPSPAIRVEMKMPFSFLKTCEISRFYEIVWHLIFAKIFSLIFTKMVFLFHMLLASFDFYVKKIVDLRFAELVCGSPAFVWKYK